MGERAVHPHPFALHRAELGGLEHAHRAGTGAEAGGQIVDIAGAVPRRPRIGAQRRAAATMRGTCGRTMRFANWAWSGNRRSEIGRRIEPKLGSSSKMKKPGSVKRPAPFRSSLRDVRRLRRLSPALDGPQFRRIDRRCGGASSPRARSAPDRHGAGRSRAWRRGPRHGRQAGSGARRRARRCR